MRIFTKILSIIFVIVFIFCVSISIILGVSSSTFAKDEDARRNIYFSSAYKLANNKTISITATTPYSLGEEGQYTKETATCVTNKDDQTTNCSMISRLYNADASLVRTSYFPGDGYKYTNINGEAKGTKTPYSNDNLQSYCASFILGVNMYLALLSSDTRSIEESKLDFDSNIKFDFNTFSLFKNITIKYEISNTKQIIGLKFDKNDFLRKVEIKASTDTEELTTSINIDYKKANLDFSSLVGYTEA